MFANFARSFHASRADQPAAPAAAAWRWRYRDPATGEIVSFSELLTPAEISAIDPSAELIPGSRVFAAASYRGASAAR